MPKGITNKSIAPVCPTDNVLLETVWDCIRPYKSDQKGQWIAVCPSCKDDRDHFSFNPETRQFGCWKCNFGAGMNIKSLLEYFGRWDRDLVERAKEGNTFNSIFSKLENKTDGDATNLSLSDMVKMILDGTDIKQAYNELSGGIEKKSNIRYDVLPSNGIRLPNDSISIRQSFMQYLYDRNISDEEMEIYNMYAYIDGYKWGGRIMLPIFEDGKLVGYGGRSIMADTEMKYRYEDDWKKEKYVYGIDFLGKNNNINDNNINDNIKNNSNILDDHGVIICEGVFDVISVRRVFPNNVVAIFGSFMSDDQFDKLYDRGYRRFYFLLDADAKKKLFSKNFIDRFRGYIECYFCDISVYDGLYGEDKDGNEIKVDVGKLGEMGDNDKIEELIKNARYMDELFIHMSRVKYG